jgi:hypothetical protein
VAESLKRYRVMFGYASERQYLYLMAKSKAQAEQLAGEYQFRRKTRFPLTFHRLDQSLEAGQIDKAMHKAQSELRKADQERSEDGKWKLLDVKEVS